MRLVVELTVDATGRPRGVVVAGEGEPADRFDDWLDLLRVLEAQVERTQQAGCESSP